ncbi:MAG: trigger factor [Deltaproteobacteria bacterium]|nr:trigger factor [Deltaproteobacteria bacterium]
MGGSEIAEEIAVEISEVSPVLRDVTVLVGEGRVRRAYTEACRALAKRVRVRGFRLGRAPDGVLLKLYGPDLAQDAQRRLLEETLPEAIAKSGLVPVSEPAISSDAPLHGQPFRYRAAVEVRPPMVLPPLEGLPAPRSVIAVKEAEVEAELEALRLRRAVLVDEPPGTAAQRGSFLVVDYDGRIEGQPFENGSAQDVLIELGSGRFLQGFEEQLEGAVLDEQRSLQITFPDAYPDESLRGKQAEFSVRVKRLQRRELPALDDAFAASLGDAELRDLPALRARLRAQLEALREQAADEAQRRALLGALAERTPFEIPPRMLRQRLDHRVTLACRQFARLLAPQELQAQAQRWREEWRPDVEREVREFLLLEAVAEAREITVSDAELDGHIEALAREQGMAPERLREAYQERHLAEDLRGRIRRQRALEFLLSVASIAGPAGA